MSSLLTEALSLYNLAAVGIFGIVLSAAFCEIEWTRRHKLLLVGCTILMLALQGVVSLRWGTGRPGGLFSPARPAHATAHAKSARLRSFRL